MKKTLITLATLGAMATPNAHTKINTTVDAKKNLVEVLSKKQTSSGKEQKTISFEDARKKYEAEKTTEEIKEILNDTEIQKALEEGSKEGAENTDEIADKIAEKIIEKTNLNEKEKNERKVKLVIKLIPYCLAGCATGILIRKIIEKIKDKTQEEQDKED